MSKSFQTLRSCHLPCIRTRNLDWVECPKFAEETKKVAAWVCATDEAVWSQIMGQNGVRLVHKTIPIYVHTCTEVLNHNCSACVRTSEISCENQLSSKCHIQKGITKPMRTYFCTGFLISRPDILTMGHHTPPSATDHRRWITNWLCVIERHTNLSRHGQSHDLELLFWRKHIEEHITCRWGEPDIYIYSCHPNLSRAVQYSRQDEVGLSASLPC